MKNSFQHTSGIKWLLFGIAIIVLFIGFLFVNSTISDIRKEERTKVILWAEAVQQRTSLLERTSTLFDKLKDEEQQRVELWREAQQLIMNVDDNQFLTFLLEIISTNKNIPIILTDAHRNVVSTMNLDVDLISSRPIPVEIEQQFSKYQPLKVVYNGKVINYLYYSDSQLFNELQDMINNMIHSFIVEVVQNSVSVPVVITTSDTTEVLAYGNITEQKLKELSSLSLQSFIQDEMYENQAIPIMLSQNVEGLIFYQDSELINKWKFYPIVLILLLIGIIVVAYVTFRSFDKHDKDQLWVGMSKETAHQLGTPISSLMAWLELLKMKDVEPEIIEEIGKDVTRLETIAGRFSKIGSESSLTKENINDVVLMSANYMKNRSSQNVTSIINIAEKPLYVMLNASLFAWVIENLWKNAIDAMHGTGTLTIDVCQENQSVVIDVKDTGKGIPRKKFKTIFKPGYTTKTRGWGLGLSLAQRIVSEYHKGKIFVKSSEIDKGTTIRIVLPVVE